MRQSVISSKSYRGNLSDENKKRRLLFILSLNHWPFSEVFENFHKIFTMMFKSRMRNRVLSEEVILNAGEAFGSGAHPTTRLCIDMLHLYLKPGDHFLDIGTGSGILMIIASRLGATHVVGFDKYTSIVKTANENLISNRITDHQGSVFVANSPSPIRCRFDIVAVNILPGIILSLLGDLPDVLHFGGLLLCAGMILGNTHQVEAGLEKIGFKIVHKDCKDLWVGIAAKRLA